MNKYLIGACALTLSVLTVSTASASASETTNASTIERVQVEPYIIINAGTATVTKYYTNTAQIPDSIYFTDYHPTWGNRWGTLYLQSIVPSGNGYRATYYGSMSAQLEDVLKNPQILFSDFEYVS